MALSADKVPLDINNKVSSSRLLMVRIEKYLPKKKEQFSKEQLQGNFDKIYIDVGSIFKKE